MKAALVGPAQQENLALGYLAAFVRHRGHDAVILEYTGPKDLEKTVRRVLVGQPELVGLGLSFQSHIDDYALLVRELRARGYAGHVTCGGHVSTFCWQELLTDLPGLDTVVRHDGEETLAEMLDALARGHPPRDIAGLVWRDADHIVRGPVRTPGNLDTLPWPARSSEPYTVGGVVVDFLLTARGCVGECNYCSIAAYTSEQRKPYRLRSPDSVAEEIAFAYHQRGARAFFVQDDLFVLPAERQAIARMAQLRAAIEARGVADAVFWIKGRPECITPAVASAAREMGAIHMFLGVENASASRLAYLGRSHLPRHNEAAIEHCRRAGIGPSFNFMLFDPDCCIEDVSATLDLADGHADLPWNVCRTEVYSGTALQKRLLAEGRLEGTYRTYGYRMSDERAEVLFRILRVSLHERALALDSLLNRLISLSFARQLHAHCYASEATDALDRAIVDLGARVRRDTVQRIRAAIEVVRGKEFRDVQAIRRFAVQQALNVGAFDMPLRVQAESLWNRLHARGRVFAGSGRARSAGEATPAARERGGFEVAVGS